MMSDCTPSKSGKPHPDKRNANAPDKLRANIEVKNMFVQQGLQRSRLRRQAVICFNDTPELQTATVFSEHCFDDIGLMIIVEIKSDKAKLIEERITRERYRFPPTIVICSEIIKFLEGTDIPIDFIWLDIMNVFPYGIGLIFPCLRNARSLAVTVSNRIRSGGYGAAEQRTNTLSHVLKSVFEHKLLDWGYKIGESMQVLVYGKKFAECLYRPHEVRPIRGCATHCLVKFYGYREFELQKGTVESWRNGEDDNVDSSNDEMNID